MKIYEPREGMYDYQYLPAFARFILDSHLEAYAADQLTVARSVNLPALKHLGHLSDEQIHQFGINVAREFLTHLAQNQARTQIVTSLERWLKDTLPLLGKFQISAEDVTVFNHMRSKLFRKWLQQYDVSVDDKFKLLDEIEDFLYGQTISSLDVYVDILNQKLKDESHLSARLINTSPGVIFIFDLIANKEVFITGNVEQIMGYRADEVIGMESNLLAALTHPEDIPVLLQHMDEVRRTTDDRTYHLEYRFLHKDGTYRWIRTYDTVFRRDADGNTIQLLGTSFEITREKMTALALEKRESQLLEAQSLVHIGSFEWDIERDESVNTPELMRIFELESNQSQQEFLAHVHPDDKKMVQDLIAESLVTGKYDCQYRYRHKSEEKVLWARGVVLFRDGKPSMMRGTVQDITHFKKIESELISKTRELERSNESLQQFASIASHDLKEPLRKMSMYSDLVLTNESKVLSESSRASLTKVKSSSIRMLSMIDDILNFSTLSADEGKVPVDLKQVFQDACVILDETIADRGAKITTNDLPVIPAIPAQMRQLFQNLLSNAFKFARPNEYPKVTVTAYPANSAQISKLGLSGANYACIEVRDEGIGFRQEHAERIFNLFARLHGKGTYEGSGLGLSICKRIAQNHGGGIYAQSTVGGGASFFVLLPTT